MIKRTIDREVKENQYLTKDIKDPFMKNYVDEQMYWYIRKAIFNKYCYYIFTIITIVCPIVSGVIFVLPISNNWIKPLSEVILGLSSLSAALLPLFEFKKKWGMYRDEAEQLKSFLVYYNMDGNLKNLVNNVERSKMHTHKKWYGPFQDKTLEENKEKKGDSKTEDKDT